MAVRVGVIGAGGMGTRHARNLTHKVSGVQVVAVMDADAHRAQALAAELGGARVYTDAAALIADPDVQAVVVASPDDTHAGLVLACLERAKPVFCEKPLATRVGDAQRIVQQELALGRRLVQVGFMRRYDRDFQRVKEAVANGAVGRPVFYRGWHRNERLPYTTRHTSETVLVNSAIHDLDEMRWLSGQEITRVYVVGRNLDPNVGKDTYDLQVIQLDLSGGGLAVIELNVSVGYGYEVGVEVSGDQGTVLAGVPGGPVHRRQGLHAHPVPPNWLVRFEDAYVAEIQAWVRALQGDGQPTPTAWDGYVSLLVAEAAMESLRRGVPCPVPAVERPPLYAE